MSRPDDDAPDDAPDDASGDPPGDPSSDSPGDGVPGGGAPLVLGAGGPVAAEGSGQSLITYPATIAVKAIGENVEVDGTGLAELVETIVVPLVEPGAVRIEAIPSSRGRYVSVRAHFTATSHAQLRAIYGALHGEPRVLQTL